MPSCGTLFINDLGWSGRKSNVGISRHGKVLLSYVEEGEVAEAQISSENGADPRRLNTSAMRVLRGSGWRMLAAFPGGGSAISLNAAG